MENKRSVEYYDSCVRDVKLEDITSSEYNAKALRKLRDNDPDFTTIALTDTADEFDDFIVTNNDDLGWLGYFIGRNRQLKELFIYDWLEGDSDHSKIDALAQGISLNTSISMLGICSECGDLFLQRLGNLFKSNKSLIHLELFGFDIGLASARNLAVMLQDMSSLESFQVERLCYDSDSENFIDEGGVTEEIITALSKHTNLERLHIWTCDLDRSSCMALGRLSSLKELKLCRSNVDAKGMKVLAGDMLCNLESVDIYRTSIDYDYEKEVALSPGLASLPSLKKIKMRRSSIGDDDLQRLVAAMANNTALEVLDISENTSITANGLRSLSILLQSEKCRLRELVLQGMHIGDEGAEILAEALVGNKSLKLLEFCDLFSRSARERTGITTTGWSAFTRLLCDTSSINNTYLSNHTLEICRTTHAAREAFPFLEIDDYLSANQNQPHVAMYKILKNHPDFDMRPLLLWKLKFLPFIVAWFKASRRRWKWPSWTWGESISSLQRRELSAIFQFVRGLPLLTVASWRKRNQKIQDTGTDSKKRKFDHL